MKKNAMLLRIFALVLALMLSLPMMAGAETTDAAELAEGADIRIMSYNIMHPDWSKSPIKNRSQAVLNILDYYKPDVVGVQEADAKWQRFWITNLIDTGLYAPACRQSNADGFQFNLTTFLYNPQTIKLIDEYVLDLDANSNIRVLAVAVFEKIADGSRFVVCNTHPASSTEVENYTRNCADIMTLAAQEMAKYADLPFFMTGDYNTNEGSEMYQTIMTTLGLQDAKYAAETMVRNHVTYVEWNTDPAENPLYYIDHIFVNDKANVKLFNVVIDYDANITSDHFPIYADIDLK